MTEGGDKECSPRQYSKAFDNFVQDDSDIVGLLAYALFKRAIREEAEQGKRSAGNTRNPSKTVVSTYRQAAERELGQVVSASIEEAKPEIQGSAALSAIEGARSDIMQHVSNRTGFGQALLVNIVAWGFTLFLTVVIVYLATKPEPQRAIMDKAHQTLSAVHNSN